MNFDQIQAKNFCRHCKGWGYFLATNSEGDSAVASCGSCEAGAFLRNHERRPIASVTECIEKGYQHVKTLSPYKDSLKAKTSPWPAKIEGLMLIARDLMNGKHAYQEAEAESAFAFGCRFCKISVEEGWKLYELFVAKEFAHPFAQELIARSTSESVLQGLFGAMTGPTESQETEKNAPRFEFIDPDRPNIPEGWENPF